MKSVRAVPIAPRSMLGWIDTSVHGPMVRTVRDAAMYIDVTNGTHEADPTSLPRQHYNYADVLEQLPKKLRIGWSPTLGYANIERDVLREAENAAKAFEEMGHSVELVEAPISDTGNMWSKIGSAETYAFIHDKIEDHRDDFGRAFLAATELDEDDVGEVRARADGPREVVQELWLSSRSTTDADADAAWRRSMARRGPQWIDGSRETAAVVAFSTRHLSGHPASSVRAGSAITAPVGLQIVGRGTEMPGAAGVVRVEQVGVE